MFSVASKTCKYFIKLLISNNGLNTNKNFYSYKLLRFKNFCEKIEMFKENDQEELLSNKLKTNNLNLSNLTINILKYLENNYQLYKRLCEDSVKLSYELSEHADGGDFLKAELLRINRQISTFSKDNHFYEELKRLILNIESSLELYNEALEIQDEEIKNSAIQDLDSNRKKLEELQQDIIEYFIPDESVITS